MTRKSYPSDFSDDEWTIFEAIYYQIITTKRGRPRKIPLREIFNALRYISRSGCQWRMLPHDLPDWRNVYDHYKRWVDSGLLIKLNDALRCDLRVLADRSAEVSAAIIDSQSVKSAEYSKETGYDAGKRIKGVKRHILVDAMGLLLAVMVHSAALQDRVAAKLVVTRFRFKFTFPRLRLIWVDGGYSGTLLEWARYNYNLVVEIVKKIKDSGFHVLRRR